MKKTGITSIYKKSIRQRYIRLVMIKRIRGASIVSSPFSVLFRFCEQDRAPFKSCSWRLKKTNVDIKAKTQATLEIRQQSSRLEKEVRKNTRSSPHSLNILLYVLKRYKISFGGLCTFKFVDVQIEFEFFDFWNVTRELSNESNECVHVERKQEYTFKNKKGTGVCKVLSKLTNANIIITTVRVEITENWIRSTATQRVKAGKVYQIQTILCGDVIRL